MVDLNLMFDCTNWLSSGRVLGSIPESENSHWISLTWLSQWQPRSRDLCPVGGNKLLPIFIIMGPGEMWVFSVGVKM